MPDIHNHCFNGQFKKVQACLSWELPKDHCTDAEASKNMLNANWTKVKAYIFAHGHVLMWLSGVFKTVFLLNFRNGPNNTQCYTTLSWKGLPEANTQAY